MKKALHTAAGIIVILAACACGRMEVSRQGGEIAVEIGIDSYSLLMDGATKAERQLDPSVENTIANLWLLQYVNGRLEKAEYIDESYTDSEGRRPLETPVLSTSLKTTLAEGLNSNIVVIANMGGVNKDDSEWPSGKDFKWGAHGAASYSDLQNKLFSVDLSDPKINHLYMVGSSYLDVTDSQQGKVINMMLSRLGSKIKISVSSKNANKYGNVRLCVQNVPSKTLLFPVSADSGRYEYISYSEQPVTGAGEYLSGDAKSFYFYVNENLATTQDNQIRIEIKADINGSAYKKDVPVSATGTVYRNTYYNIELSLK